MKHDYATLPLHSGKAPAWLFKRMTALAEAITEIIVMEAGPDRFLEYLSDPFWFQCLGCILGFDWHSSGVTTTVCGALKEAIHGKEAHLGIFIGGGKGRASRKTPDEIRRYSEIAGTDAERLVYASRMSAKVDNSALQDGFTIYHHCFFFTPSGKWAVVQQGMNETTGWARRYHWLSDDNLNFVCEPHKAICSDNTLPTLNMVAAEAHEARVAATEVSHLRPERLLAELRMAAKHQTRLYMPQRHRLLFEDINPKKLYSIFVKTYEYQAKSFEDLLSLEGVGPRTIRALSLVGELLYGAKPSFRDPARFSFAHGGKDGTPYPVDRRQYDLTISILKKAISEAKTGQSDKLQALRRMSAFISHSVKSENLETEKQNNTE
jgi:hypothetical protein